MKKISENGYSLEDLLKNVTDENIHPEISTEDHMGAEILNEDEILGALSKVPGTDDILSKSERAKYLESIKKLNIKVKKEPLQFKDGFSIISIKNEINVRLYLFITYVNYIFVKT